QQFISTSKYGKISRLRTDIFQQHSTKNKKGTGETHLCKKLIYLLKGGQLVKYIISNLYCIRVTLALRSNYLYIPFVYFDAFNFSSKSSIYFCAASAAILPSPVAVTICRRFLSRISPAAKTPGTLVSIFSFVGI